MTQGSILMESKLKTYIVNDRDPNIPLALKEDLLVRYVKDRIDKAICPFCKRHFKNKIGVRFHISNENTRCGKMLIDFINLTIERYYLIRVSDMKPIRRLVK